MNVCLIGTGYVGLVTGACLAYLGHEVACADIDADKIALLRAGRAPLYEPGIEELLDHGLSGGRLSFTTSLEEAMLSAEVIFIAVGTPPRPDGSPDLGHLKAAAQGIGRCLLAGRAPDRFRAIVNKSTVPVVGRVPRARAGVAAGRDARRGARRRAQHLRAGGGRGGGLLLHRRRPLTGVRTVAHAATG